MRIKYTITTKSCPNCGKTLKMENTLVYMLLAILFFPLAIIYGIYFWGRASLEGKLAYIPSVGNPFKICSKCGAKVRVKDKMLYEELSLSQRYIYENRAVFQTCYITKAMAIVFGLMSLLIFSDASLDFIVACISIPLAIVSFIVFQISKKKCQELTSRKRQIIADFCRFLLALLTSRRKNRHLEGFYLLTLQPQVCHLWWHLVWQNDRKFKTYRTNKIKPNGLMPIRLYLV